MSNDDWQLECICNLSQCVRDSDDLSLVARTHSVVERYLEEHTTLAYLDIDIFTEINRTHLTKLLNNMMFLQGRRKQTAYNYFNDFRSNMLNPDAKTYTVTKSISRCVR